MVGKMCWFGAWELGQFREGDYFNYAIFIYFHSVLKNILLT